MCNPPLHEGFQEQMFALLEGWPFVKGRESNWYACESWGGLGDSGTQERGEHRGCLRLWVGVLAGQAGSLSWAHPFVPFLSSLRSRLGPLGSFTDFTSVLPGRGCALVTSIFRTGRRVCTISSHWLLVPRGSTSGSGRSRLSRAALLACGPLSPRRVIWGTGPGDVLPADRAHVSAPGWIRQFGVLSSAFSLDPDLLDCCSSVATHALDSLLLCLNLFIGFTHRLSLVLSHRGLGL